MGEANATEDLAARWRDYADGVRKPRSCMHCGATRLWWDGRPTRTASVVCAGEVAHITGIVCRRVKCGVCKQSWRLRPPGMVPHKHYQLCVVAQASNRYVFSEQSTLTSVAAELGCSRRTVARWLGWLAAIAEPAVLLQRVLEAVDAPVVPRRVAHRAGKARGAIGRALLARVAEVVGLCEVLGSAWRLEPPGLRAVVERVLGNRSGVATYARPVIPELARSPA